MPYLAPEQARRVYDRIGRFQNVQLYERRALDVLVEEGRFAEAYAVVETGCGTGGLAERLLARELPRDARYAGVDVSPHMTELATARLARFAGRVQVRLGDATEHLPVEDNWADRVVAAYVLDLLSPPRAGALLTEAARTLAPGGLLCLVSLTHGRSPAGRLLTAAWERLWRLRPQLVGGCRPTDLRPLLAGPSWDVRTVRVVTQLAVASQVVVARRAG